MLDKGGQGDTSSQALRLPLIDDRKHGMAGFPALREPLQRGTQGHHNRARELGAGSLVRVLIEEPRER